MKIPASFKLGPLEFQVKLVDEVTVSAGSCRSATLKGKGLVDKAYNFGACDPTAQIIWLATKDISGDALSKERIITTFYHELAHALVGETANLEACFDEVFIEALGKNIYSYILTVSDEEATYHEEEEEYVEEEIKPRKKGRK